MGLTELRPFQKEGVRRIYQFRGRALLGDEMGLGKTIQALAWINKIPSHRPVVIVSPASMKYTWQAEASLHFGMHAEVLEGFKKKKQKTVPGKIVIVNYEILSSWLDLLLDNDPRVIVLDEIHYIKNPDAQRTKAALRLVEDASSVLGLSGTPLTNKPVELWTTIQAIRPDLFKSFTKYAFRYCKPKYGPRGWEYNGSAHEQELHEILVDNMMIRRLKKDVYPELPSKQRKMVSMKLSSYVEYNHAEDDFLGWLRKISPARANRAQKSKWLVRIGYLLRLTARLKLKFTTEWIKEFLEVHPDKKLVCLTMHTPVIKHLKNVFPDILVINGSVSGKKREETKRRFQNVPRARLLVGNWKAAGVGITLTAAHSLAALDFPWTPGDLFQGEDRIHRIGQKEKCIIYYLTAINTIEEKLINLLRDKAHILDAILNGKRSSEDLDIFGDLIRSL